MRPRVAALGALIMLGGACGQGSGCSEAVTSANPAVTASSGPASTSTEPTATSATGRQLRTEILQWVADKSAFYTANQPDTFGGGSVDPLTGNAEFRFTVPTSVDEVATDAPFPDRVTVEQVAHPLSALQQAADRLSASYEQIRAEGIPVFLIGPSMRRNVVEVLLDREPTPADVQRLGEISGLPEAVEVSLGQPPVNEHTADH